MNEADVPERIKVFHGGQYHERVLHHGQNGIMFVIIDNEPRFVEYVTEEDGWAVMSDEDAAELLDMTAKELAAQELPIGQEQAEMLGEGPDPFDPPPEATLATTRGGVASPKPVPRSGGRRLR